MKCNLKYIPDRLHTNERPIINSFNIGEKLFYRCHKVVEKPYDTIPLYDISHNRNFNSNSNCLDDDVLYNILPNDERERYELPYITLTVLEINKDNIFTKEIISRDDSSIKVRITLIHSPIPCMYSHSAFEIKLNENVVINRNNYKKTLGRKNILYTNLKSDVRQILTSMIQTGNIIDTEIEIILEP